MRLAFPLTFHGERSQPLSDIIEDAAEVFLTSKKPIELNVSIMTSRGLTFLEKALICQTPFKIPYEPPWGRDWSVLQLMSPNPANEAEEPFEVLLTINTI